MCEERGIFCELNLSKCISYGIPPGSSSRSLKTLRKALLEEGEAEVDMHGVSLEEKTDVSTSTSVFTDVAYLDTNAGRSRRSASIPFSTHTHMAAAIGMISAETVSVEFLSHNLFLFCLLYSRAILHY